MGFGQYLKETQAELRHVAWPTRVQTIVYTIFVALISIGVALYLGLFDYLFTSGLARGLNILPAAQQGLEVQQAATGTLPVAPAATTPQAPENKNAPKFKI